MSDLNCLLPVALCVHAAADLARELRALDRPLTVAERKLIESVDLLEAARPTPENVEARKRLS